MPLPAELWRAVLACLPLRELARSMVLVCRQWAGLTLLDDTFWCMLVRRGTEPQAPRRCCTSWSSFLFCTMIRFWGQCWQGAQRDVEAVLQAVLEGGVVFLLCPPFCGCEALTLM